MLPTERLSIVVNRPGAAGCLAWTKGMGCARRVSFMIMPAILFTSLGLGIPVADTVPRYDVRSTCRAAVTLAAGSEGRTVESCMAGEEVARKFAYATLTLV